MKNTIKPSDFVKRQIPGSGKTYSKTLNFEEIAEIAQDKLNSGDFVEGYRDGVVLIEISGKRKY